ncbi:23S rRNA (uracil(1939)-C(5))-methyltransferase RlmD [Glaciecola sp. 1036]|uniref:23S rRNA (uracil(1939)-C(5))-methyltransferase RlmD n=1 Tax=Alteromonadaceae TaxID=72275 RepID=UPI003D0665D4
MARIFKPKANKTKPSRQTVKIDVVDDQGIGICLSTQPITLVKGALPEELVDIDVTNANKQVQQGKIIRVSNPSDLRVSPFCQHYNGCGGCSLQHLSQEKGIDLKMQAFQRRLAHKYDISQEVWHPPITSNQSYRRKVRMSVDARNPKHVKIGYRAANSNNIVDIENCPILTPGLQPVVKNVLPVLKKLKGIKKLGHIVFLETDNVQIVSLHCTGVLPSNDVNDLIEFSDKHGSKLEISSEQEQQYSNLNDKDLIVTGYQELRLNTSTKDFLQVNPHVNQQMLSKAMQWLAPEADDVAYDFFAGAGNFSLALASKVNQVFAYEVSQEMAERSLVNATNNKIDNLFSQQANLDDIEDVKKIKIKPNGIVVLDPARAGANTLCQMLGRSKARKILYISCNPSSFLRDIEHLMQSYAVSSIGALDMFPYTEHMELMALFERRDS